MISFPGIRNTHPRLSNLGWVLCFLYKLLPEATGLGKKVIEMLNISNDGKFDLSMEDNAYQSTELDAALGKKSLSGWSKLEEAEYTILGLRYIVADLESRLEKLENRLSD